MTRRQWDALWWTRFRALRKAHPTEDMDKIRERARQQCIKEHGPRPPSLTGAWLKVAVEFVKRGGNVDFSWTKNLWKAVKAGLVTALSVAAIAGVGALLEPIDSAQELGALGIPGWAIPALVAAIVSLKNYLKVKKGVRAAKVL